MTDTAIPIKPTKIDTPEKKAILEDVLTMTKKLLLKLEEKYDPLKTEREIAFDRLAHR